MALGLAIAPAFAGTEAAPAQVLVSADGHKLVFDEASISGEHAIALYDANGNYIDTLKKSDWNSKVPGPVKSSFDLSNYKSQKVTSYWEVANASQKVYY